MPVSGTDGFPFLLPFWTIECKRKGGSQVEGGGWFVPCLACLIVYCLFIVCCLY